MKSKIALKKLEQLLVAPNFTSKEARDCGVLQIWIITSGMEK